MTLREAIQGANREAIFDYLFKKSEIPVAADPPTRTQVVNAYGKVMDELLSKPSSPPDDMPIVVQMVSAMNEESYIGVVHRNTKFVPPPEGLKPWGGKNPPEGHYDCNNEIHNEFFGFGYTPWSKVIDTPIENPTDIPWTDALAAILWELTFMGWTEESHKKQIDELATNLSDRIAEIDSCEVTDGTDDND